MNDEIIERCAIAFYGEGCAEAAALGMEVHLDATRRCLAEFARAAQEPEIVTKLCDAFEALFPNRLGAVEREAAIDTILAALFAATGVAATESA